MIFAMGGIFFLFLGIYLIYEDKPKKRKTCKMEAPGKIVDIIRKDNTVYSGERADYQIIYYPVLEYEVEGEVIRSQLYFGSEKPKTFQKNDNYTVYYNEYNPKEFYIIVDRKGTSAGIICLVIGLALVLLNGGFY